MDIVLDSYINGTFYGWSGSTLFKLGNNSFWIQTRYAYNYHYAYRPSAKIIQDAGAYFLEVENVGERVEVKRVTDIIESQIKGTFKGWKSKTQFELTNGQTWEQTEYNYMYHYAYRPTVLIYNTQSGYRISVEGTKETTTVKRIK
ncbi:hypothetical protein CA600_12500 [Paenibacillus sp. VTT E-133280]|uniref:hypothetical protein n=1 Tax=Paenibacillus sp. VTT E-133280 TaxID=1986222 RepID=UPI000BA09D90|nr:hypothetical protein [Paenibacillus sp. VTT E-133280]OZQ66073.1 hypothetical protein CA600_12500 [Paenibacillus sp. VTT E-133280]